MANPTAADIVRAVPMIPVLTLEPGGDAIAICRALAEGGLTVLEVTLRTRGALEVVAQLRRALPEVVVGVGTVLSAPQVSEAVGAGAQFLVTPGTTTRLLPALASAGVPVLPGCSTISEMMELSEAGFTLLKFFPAEPAGGTPFLKAVSGPLPALRFCPTGGIDLHKAREYLALPNVVCVGGSWVVPPTAVRERDWSSITLLAKAAALLKRQQS